MGRSTMVSLLPCAVPPPGVPRAAALRHPKAWVASLGRLIGIPPPAIQHGAVSDRDSDPEEPEPRALPIDGILDLHTFQPREVKDLVGDYLDECRRLGVLEIRIIHGKGTGTLRRVVHGVLERRTDVASFGLAPPHRGGWGATLVTLHPA